MWSGTSGAGSDASTLQELRALAALARTSRLIGAREEGIIVNAARLSRTPLRAVMLPEPFISTIVADEPLEAALLAAHHDMHTRFPVTEVRDDRQRIVGYVNFKDIVSGVRLSPLAPSVRSILRPMASFDSELPAASAFERLILEHQHIALVRDGSGRVLGMVTLEDILEELVGEIHDEFDRLPSQLVRSGPGWICGGGVTVKQLADVTGLPWPGLDSAPSTTLDAWVEQHLGRAPSGGDVVDDGPVRVLVRKLRRHRVYEAQVSPRT
jgi:putative hemolysin